MKTFLRILGLVALLIIVFAIYAATRPGSYDVKRTKVMDVPTPVVFDVVNEYRTWEEWGPWKDVDPSIQPTYQEQTSGVGAGYSWTSDQDGPGKMETLALTPNESIEQKIYFDRRGSADVYWKFQAQENATEVTWGMKGELSFMEKVFFTLMGGAEKLFGNMLSSGLDKLDVFAKDELVKHEISDEGVVDYGGGYFIHLTSETDFDAAAPKMQELFGQLTAYVQENNVPISGVPFTLYHKYDEANKITEFSVCYPVAERLNTEGDVGVAFMESGRYFKTSLKGDYKFLEEAWQKAFELAEKDGIAISDKGKPFEVYTKGMPQIVNPTQFVTDIYLPVE